jgi:hypothetical protein
VNWQENQDSSIVEHQARDLEVQVRVLVQVQIFLLKFNKVTVVYGAGFAVGFLEGIGQGGGSWKIKICCYKELIEVRRVWECN